jgi:hypothetical protein
VPVPAAPVVVTPPLRDAAGGTRIVSVQMLRSHFENPDRQRRALAVLKPVVAGGWLDPVGNPDLYEASQMAFDPWPGADEAFRYFEKIYNELKQPGKWGWSVFRPSSPADCWPPHQIYEPIKREVLEFSRDGPVNLMSFSRSEVEPRLRSCLTKMRGIKPKQDYPSMTVSKFLHFYNPRLFPVYDYEVIWKKTLYGRFRNDFREFCCREGFPYRDFVRGDTVDFLPGYMRWASSLLSAAHEAFMEVFVEWLEEQPGVELRQRRFKAATLYATAFEFTAIGATEAS